MTGERRTGKYFEGSCCGLIDASLRDLPGGTDEDHLKCSGYSRVLAEIRTEYLQNINLESYSYTTLLSSFKYLYFNHAFWEQNI
jgi:hypothetical protein